MRCYTHTNTHLHRTLIFLCDIYTHFTIYVRLYTSIYIGASLQKFNDANIKIKFGEGDNGNWKIILLY